MPEPRFLFTWQPCLVRLGAIACLSLGCSGFQTVSPKVESGRPVEVASFPTADKDWRVDEHASADWDQAALEEAIRFAGEHRTTGIVIVQAGRLIAEPQKRCRHPGTCAESCAGNMLGGVP